MAPIKVLLVFSYKLKFVRIKTDAIAVFQQDLFVGDKRLPVEECLIAALQITEIKLPIVEPDLCVVRRHRVKGDRDIILLMAAYFGHGLELIGGFLGVRAQVIQHDLWHRHTRFGTPRATDRHDADNPEYDETECNHQPRAPLGGARLPGGFGCWLGRWGRCRTRFKGRGRGRLGR